MNARIFVIENVNRNRSYEYIKYILKKYYNILKPNFYKNEYGKPYIVDCDWYFNISHCDDLMVCIFATSEVGIDVEKIREYNPLLENKIFSIEEQKTIKGSREEFWKLWTIKESFLKYQGTGIIDELYKTEVLYNSNISIKNSSVQINVKEYNGYIISICSKEKIKNEELILLKKVSL